MIIKPPVDVPDEIEPESPANGAARAARWAGVAFAVAAACFVVAAFVAGGG